MMGITRGISRAKAKPHTMPPKKREPVSDDFQKLRHHANEGLTAAQKFLLQLAAAIS